MSEVAIPMGFRFNPNDEELIKYLLLQVKGAPLPWSGIIYKGLYGPNAAPWVVFGNNDCHWWPIETKEGGATKSVTFVFTKLIKVIPNSQRSARTAGDGTWWGNSLKKIVGPGTGETIGFMRALSYKYSGGVDYGRWTMHEYSLSHETTAADLVVCKITRYVNNNSPQTQSYFSPEVADGKRDAAAEEECYDRECKRQKLCGDGLAAEVPPLPLPLPHLFSPKSCNEEIPVAPIDEQPRGGAADQEEEEDDELWRESIVENFDKIVKSYGGPQPQENDSLQLPAPLSPFDEFDFSSSSIDEVYLQSSFWS